MLSAQFFVGLLPTIVVFCTGVFPALIMIYIFKRQTKERKSPLNKNLLRSPGETLREELDKLSDDILESALALCIGPLTVYSIFISQIAVLKKPPSLWLCLFIIVIVGCFCIWQVRKLYKMIVKRNRYQLGYECELAVGQQLCLLERDGYRVFHDFPATNDFNIDHIAVGPHGVFAVETKGRAKPVRAKKENWKVNFDGEKLIFPQNYETRPVEQARYQARWLSRWIKTNVQVEIGVTPILAIPGWYIEFPKQTTEVKVCNGSNFSFLIQKPFLSENQVNKISSWIEKECRTVKTRAYSKK